jgi:Protein of unknown function (DUF3489)
VTASPVRHTRKDPQMKLTDTHLMLLSAAAQHEQHLLSRPNRFSDKAAQSLATKLIRAGLAEKVPVPPGQPCWRADVDTPPVGLKITGEGLAAIGLEAADEPCTVAPDEAAPQPTWTPRAGSKQAVVLDLLRRGEGATLEDLMAATGWLPHTTRAALTGFRKRGYLIARLQGEDGRAVYHIDVASRAMALAREEA